MNQIPSDTPTDPTVQHQLEEHRQIAAEQARGWHILYFRPTAVTWAGISMATIGVIALSTTPFIAAYEQMHGYLSLVHREYSIVGLVLLIGIFATPLGLLVNRGQNWARWVFALGGIGWLGWSVFSDPKMIHILFGVLYAAYIALLFNPSANRFFRPRQ